MTKRKRDSGKFSVKELKPCLFLMACYMRTDSFSKADLSRYVIPVQKNLRSDTKFDQCKFCMRASAQYKHLFSSLACAVESESEVGCGSPCFRMGKSPNHPLCPWRTEMWE